MFEIEIRRTFAAAHQLKGYDGDCRNLHGHNYSVVVTVHASELNIIHFQCTPRNSCVIYNVFNLSCYFVLDMSATTR